MICSIRIESQKEVGQGSNSFHRNGVSLQTKLMILQAQLIHLSPIEQLFSWTCFQTKFCPNLSLVHLPFQRRALKIELCSQSCLDVSADMLNPCRPGICFVGAAFPLSQLLLLSELSSGRLDINPTHWTASERQPLSILLFDSNYYSTYEITDSNVCQ